MHLLLRMKTTKLIYFFLLSQLCFFSHAQVHISGKVTDTDNQPIEFATVRIAGTAIGATTDLKGAYSLSVAEADTIEVIFLALICRSQTKTCQSRQGSLCSM